MIWPAVDSGNTRINRLIETAWSKWWRRNGVAAKLHCAVRAEAVDGEHIALRLRSISQVSRAGVALDVLPLECDRLANPNWSNSNTSDYIDGVHLDPYSRRPVAYDILKAHPGTEYLDQFTEIYEARTFPASEILHAFRALRPEQHRGVPRATPAPTLTGMHQKFLAAKVDKAALQAAIAFAIKSMAPGETEDAGGEDGTLWQTVRLPSRQGLGILFPDGYEPVQFKTDGDSQDVDVFNKIICGLYAGCFSMPLGRALGEYGGSGYAQIRGGLIPYEKALCADRRQVWEPLWLDPLYEDFLSEFRLMPAMQALLATISPDERASLDLHNVHWNWGFGDLVVDPSRERSAQEKKLRLGLSTREAELEAPDIDAHDRRAAEQLGIVDKSGAPDVMRYRRIVAQSIHGVPVEDQGDHPNDSPDHDDVTDDDDEPEPARLEANCGTGKGGFQDGNTCGKRGSGADLAEVARSTATATLSRRNKESQAEVTIEGERNQVLNAFHAVAGTRRPGALSALAGAPDDAKVTLSVDRLGIPTIETNHPAFDGPSYRALKIDDRGRKFIHNVVFELHPEAQGSHLGTAVLARQVSQAQKRGFDYLECKAASSGYNGYYTWPRLGFNQPLSTLNPQASRRVYEVFPSAKSILDVMRSKKGREWWKTNRIALPQARFNLKPGSRSNRVLQSYLETELKS